MISTRGILLTGLKKCIPIRRFGCCNTVEIFPIEMDEVLVPIKLLEDIEEHRTNVGETLVFMY